MFLGVFLFTVLILFYGFILSTEILSRTFPQGKEFFAKVDQAVGKDSTKVILAIGGIFGGIWNFFAPDFGTDITIIGALIPSVILIIDGTILYPNIINLLNIPQEKKDQYFAFIEKYKGIAGVITIISGFMHMFLFKVILF